MQLKNLITNESFVRNIVLIDIVIESLPEFL